MSVLWQYELNEKEEQVFCPHCSDLRDTPYFDSCAGYDKKKIICLRCARVLAKLYEVVAGEMNKEDS